MKANFTKHILQFKSPSGTSRGVLTEKETYIITIENQNKKGVGECSFFKGLSIDNEDGYEEKLHWVCENITLGKDKLWEELYEFPSIQFGIEQAFINLENKENIYFPSDFTAGKEGIIINGLIWMGTIDFMWEQIAEKFSQYFNCIKLKIGVNPEEELALLQELRNSFSAQELEIRVDANGAFSIAEAEKILPELAKLNIHSIEQPIKPNQIQAMHKLCKNTQIPIALDEELIGIFNYEDKENLLEKIKPQYIILKPSLIGGFKGTTEWISIADKMNIGWWITSALESNIGLNALAQWTFILHNSLPQGLGTGNLFTNNFPSPLYLEDNILKYKKNI